MYRQQQSGKVRAGISFLPAFALLFFLLHLQCSLFAGTEPAVKDTTKQQYALNDPRNPNCPCHKLQKQAEDEYKAMQEKLKAQNIAESVHTDGIREVKHSVTSAEHVSSGSHRFRSGNSFSSWLFRYRWKREGKHGKQKKFHPDYRICIRWN